MDLVKYIMIENKTYTSNTKELKKIDPRIILLNHIDETDETLTLRLAIQVNNYEIFQLLWNNYSQIYNERDLYLCTKFCFFLPRYTFL